MSIVEYEYSVRDNEVLELAEQIIKNPGCYLAIHCTAISDTTGKHADEYPMTVHFQYANMHGKTVYENCIMWKYASDAIRPGRSYIVSAEKIRVGKRTNLWCWKRVCIEGYRELIEELGRPISENHSNAAKSKQE